MFTGKSARVVAHARAWLRLPEYVWFRAFESAATFAFRGQPHLYFHHPYHWTWGNERAVEVPIVWAAVQASGARRVLEVGNVLSHYHRVRHDVVDKYERGARVINQDIVDFRPQHAYDLIVSISTLEHVGWDEQPRDPGKIRRALLHLESMLARPGTLLVTLPLGYNSDLDAQLRRGDIHFDERICLKRISRRNHWVEVPWSEVEDARYDAPYPCANALVVGVRTLPAE